MSNHGKPKETKSSLFASFIMLNPNPIIEANFEGQLLYANPATKKYFSTLEKEGTIYPVFNDWNKTVNRLKAQNSIQEDVKINGNWFLTQYILVPKSQNVRVYFSLINEMKKIQQELEKERILLQKVMNGSKNFHLVYLDRDFNFVRVNQTYAKSCGYTPQEMVGKNHFTLYPDKENEEIFKKTRETGEPVEYKDKPFIYPDQKSRGITYWDWTLQPVKDAQGKVEGFIFSLLETTERKKNQIKLEQNAVLLEAYASQMEKLAAERAKQLSQAERLAAIGQTAGMVGHDIRNPLQAIAGELFLAKDEIDNLPDGVAKKYLQENIVSIEENLYYIDKIVADLQDYTKPLNPSSDTIRIEQAIEEALLIVNIPSKLQVSINIPKDFPTFPADFSMLKRALINLIQNAVQAMPNGGTLKISATCQNNHACININDTGQGIPQEIQTKLFTPLFTTKSKGQGFGLAVVKRLIEAQDGTITFQTQTGKGTTFTIKLPLQNP